jgi:hypothetical protein
MKDRLPRYRHVSIDDSLKVIHSFEQVKNVSELTSLLKV